MRLSDEQLVDLRQFVALTRRDGRCVQVDADGCRCLRRPDGHGGSCDWSYTPLLTLPDWPWLFHQHQDAQRKREERGTA